MSSGKVKTVQYLNCSWSNTGLEFKLLRSTDIKQIHVLYKDKYVQQKFAKCNVFENSSRHRSKCSKLNVVHE